MGRKVYDCCGGVGKHMGGCPKGGSPKLSLPRGPRRDRGKGGKVSRPGKQERGEKCPPHTPSADASKGVNKKGQSCYRCSRCGKYLGKW